MLDLTVYLPIKFKTELARKLYRLSRLKAISISCLAESIINEYLEGVDIPDNNCNSKILNVGLRLAVGERIATLRKINYLSQQELGRLTGLGRKTISRIELGDRKLDLIEAIAIAQILGVEIKEFFE